jgi:multidrug efflux pump subunit AcrA (membrane-fusion protein)
MIRLLALLTLLTACAAPAPAATPTPLPPLEVVQQAEYVVQRATLQRTLTFSGRVGPVVSQPVVFQEAGLVAAVFFQPGEPLRAGDVIAQLDTADLEHALAEAEFALRQARDEAAAALAEAHLRLRQAELHTNHAEVASAEVALARAAGAEARRLAEAQLADAQNRAQANALAVQAWQAEVARLEARTAQLGQDGEAAGGAQLAVQQLRAQLARRQAVAPFDGALLSLRVRPGDSVAAFAAVGVLADPAQLEVSAELAPATAVALSVGQAVSVTLANSGLSYPGLVRQLPSGTDPLAQQARISLPEAATASLGELASVFVLLEERRDVLTLPAAAIRTFQGRTFVIVAQEDGTRRRYDVRLGIEGDGLVEIRDGLEEGQVALGE